MRAGQFVGRVGAIAGALGIGVVILHGAAVANADTEDVGPAVRGAGISTSAGPARSDSRHAAVRAVSAPSRADSAPVSRPAAARQTAPGAAALVTRATGGSATLAPNPAAAAVTPSIPVLSPPVASVPVRVAPRPGAAVTPAPSQAAVYSPTPPSPEATVQTPYGTLGQWMINKKGQVANWVDLPYCGPGSTKANCGPDQGKIMQEPINTVFVVQAPSKYLAELQLDFAMRVSGFGPSCCSSIGYQGIVGTETFPQFPRGGLLGLGLLPPLPFGLGQTGLLGLFGYGPAYRDKPFWGENTHLRFFGGVPDGNGNYIFTASVSEENLDTTGGGLLPTHGFESYDNGRTVLLNALLGTTWLTGAANAGTIEMGNEIAPDNPTYTTGDHDGLAQVITLRPFAGFGRNG